MRDWQPIETAPEYRSVLLWVVEQDDTLIGYEVGFRKDGIWRYYNWAERPELRPIFWHELPGVPA